MFPLYAETDGTAGSIQQKNAHGANFSRLRLELRTGSFETSRTRLLTHIGADIQGLNSWYS